MRSRARSSKTPGSPVTEVLNQEITAAIGLIGDAARRYPKMLAGYGWRTMRGGILRTVDFGPRPEDARPVRELVDAIVDGWGSGAWVDLHDENAPHEAGLLTLSSEKALARLGWYPRWRFRETIRKTVTWYRAFYEGARTESLAALCRQQINDYIGE